MPLLPPVKKSSVSLAYNRRKPQLKDDADVTRPLNKPSTKKYRSGDSESSDSLTPTSSTTSIASSEVKVKVKAKAKTKISTSKDDDESETVSIKSTSTATTTTCKSSSSKSSPMSVRRLRTFPLIGHVLIFVACVIFTIVSCLVKLLEDVDPFFIAGCRSLLVFFFSLPFLCWGGMPPMPKSAKSRFSLFVRVVGSSINICLMYYVFRHMPLGDARMITSTSPIFVTFLAHMFLKESCGAFEIVNIFCTLIGVLVVMQPPFIFDQFRDPVEVEVVDDGKVNHFVVSMLCFVATIFQALSITATRALKDVNIFLITVWNSVVGTIVAFSVSLTLGSFILPSSPIDFLFLFFIGLLGFVGQCLNTLSLKLEEAGMISVINRAMAIFLSFIAQIAFFRDIPNSLTILGAFIILACVIVSAVRKWLQRSSKKNKLRRVFCLEPYVEPEVEKC